MQLLMELTSLSGVSGNEKKVRDYILDKIKGRISEFCVDSMGNLIVRKKGNGKSSKTVMIAAHMDEVGLICSNITDDGFLKFKPVGGIDPKVLVSKRVVVGDNAVDGVIGYKAVHLQTADEQNTPVKMSSLYIDIGAKDKEEASKLLSKGDFITFKSDWRELGGNKVKAKALDDRAGCAILLSLIDEEYDFDVVFAFTVQEETGLRGATIAAHREKPDVALVLEATTCSDMPTADEKDYSTKLGAGAVLSVMDASTMYDKGLVALLEKTAREKNIPYQFKRTNAGGNDSGAIHIAGEGVRTAVISIPARYIHSPSSVISIDDFMAAKSLAKNFLKEISKDA